MSRAATNEETRRVEEIVKRVEAALNLPHDVSDEQVKEEFSFLGRLAQNVPTMKEALYKFHKVYGRRLVEILIKS